MKSLSIVAIAAASILVASPVLAHEADESENAQVFRKSDKEESKDQKELSPAEHGGGLDRYGCHKNHKTGDYHCHR